MMTLVNSSDKQPDPDLRRLLATARRSLVRGDRARARRLARQATRFAPHSEAAWLTLAASSDPRPALAYAARALEINPGSETARKAIRWLRRGLSKQVVHPEVWQARIPVGLVPELAAGEALSRRRWFSPKLVISALLLVAGLVVWFGGQPAVAREPQQASAPLTKASLTPTATQTATATPTATPSPTATNTITSSPTPTRVGNLSWEYTENPADLAQEGRWIDVDVSEQTVTAYEGATPIRSFVVSTGTSAHPTVLGQFRVYVKLTATDMSGPGYYLPDVPWTMYFYRGFALHGTYWHSNFGTPMSRGCVNMTIPDAEWIFNFASVGTLVNVHP